MPKVTSLSLELHDLRHAAAGISNLLAAVDEDFPSPAAARESLRAARAVADLLKARLGLLIRVIHREPGVGVELVWSDSNDAGPNGASLAREDVLLGGPGWKTRQPARQPRRPRASTSRRAS